MTQLEPGKSYYVRCLKDASLKVTNGLPTTQFVYDGDGGRVRKTAVTSDVAASASGGGGLIGGGESASTSLSFYHSDHLGSSNVVTDSSGNQVGYTEFTPYGSTFKQTGSHEPKFKFTGKELDASTGLYFYGARYYDPQLGRFATADTIVQAPYDPQSLNRYSYCRNNPINLVDPTGHSWRKFWTKHGAEYFGAFGSFINAINTGDWNQFGRVAAITAAAFVAGAIVSWAMAPVISGLSGAMAASGTGVAFGEGFILGGMELGVPAFAGSLAGSLAGGEKFSAALRGAAIVGGATFITAGLIEGSYSAGWQDKVHFNDTRASERNQYSKYLREGKTAEANALKVKYESKFAKVYNGYKGVHTGIEIRGTMDNNGSWGFNPDFKYLDQHPIAKAKWLSGMEVKGEVYSGEIFTSFEGPISRNSEAITRLYGNIEADLSASVHPNYSYDGYNCYDWRNEKYIQSGILF